MQVKLKIIRSRRKSVSLSVNQQAEVVARIPIGYDLGKLQTIIAKYSKNMVFDYVVIHELCHTRFHNHSKKFYELLNNCMPNYKQAELWLKQNKGIINYI